MENIKYAENWQVLLIMCAYAAFICDILLIITITVFFLKYHKMMQTMLAAFINTNTKNSGISSVNVNSLGRTCPPLFTVNLPKDEQIITDLKRNFSNGICCTGYDYCMYSSCNHYHVFLLHKMQGWQRGWGWGKLP